MISNVRGPVTSLVSILLIFSSTIALADADTSYALGLEAAADHRYREALTHFRQAAEQGHGDAQRTVGLMLLYGERLYGEEIRRDRAQARRWLELAADDGCEVASFMLKASTRSPGKQARR